MIASQFKNKCMVKFVTQLYGIVGRKNKNAKFNRNKSNVAKIQ